jgi:hypothetical protein
MEEEIDMGSHPSDRGELLKMQNDTDVVLNLLVKDLIDSGRIFTLRVSG